MFMDSGEHKYNFKIFILIIFYSDIYTYFCIIYTIKKSIRTSYHRKNIENNRLL